MVLSLSPGAATCCVRSIFQGMGNWGRRKEAESSEEDGCCLLCLAWTKEMVLLSAHQPSQTHCQPGSVATLLAALLYWVFLLLLYY